MATLVFYTGLSERTVRARLDRLEPTAQGWDLNFDLVRAVLLTVAD